MHLCANAFLLAKQMALSFFVFVLSPLLTRSD